MKYLVIEEHKCNNTKAIQVFKGEKVRIGKKSTAEDGWINWVYCFSKDGAVEGWTPEQIIEIQGEVGTVLQDYSAKELNVNKGDTIEGISELNGWIWCVKGKGSDEGWLPKEKIMKQKEV